MEKATKRRLKLFIGSLPIIATSTAIVVVTAKSTASETKAPNQLLKKIVNQRPQQGSKGANKGIKYASDNRIPGLLTDSDKDAKLFVEGKDITFDNTTGNTTDNTITVKHKWKDLKENKEERYIYVSDELYKFANKFNGIVKFQTTDGKTAIHNNTRKQTIKLDQSKKNTYIRLKFNESTGATDPFLVFDVRIIPKSMYNDYNNSGKNAKADVNKLEILKKSVLSVSDFDAMKKLYEKLKEEDYNLSHKKETYLKWLSDSKNNFNDKRLNKYGFLDADPTTGELVDIKKSIYNFEKADKTKVITGDLKSFLSKEQYENYISDNKLFLRSINAHKASQKEESQGWGLMVGDGTSKIANFGKYGMNLSINGSAKHLYVGYPGFQSRMKLIGKVEPGEEPSQGPKTNVELRIIKTSDFAKGWSLEITSALNTRMKDSNEGKIHPFLAIQYLIKNLDVYKNHIIKKIDVTFKNVYKEVNGYTLFKIGIKKLEIQYKDLGDYNSYAKYYREKILKVGNALKAEDKRRQNKAVADALHKKNLTKGYGFGTSYVPKLVAKDVSTKEEIDIFNTELEKYKNDQENQLKRVLKEAKDNWTNATANSFGHLTNKELDALNQLRQGIKDRLSYEKFKKEYARLSEKDESAERAKAKILLVKSTLGFVVDPKLNVTLNKPVGAYTVKEATSYNLQVRAYNNAQEEALAIAKSLSITKYNQIKANFYSHVNNTEMNKLKGLRTAITDNKSNETFLKQFHKVRKMDLRAEAKKEKSEEINALGFLSAKDISDADIDKLIGDVKDGTTFDKFVVAKDKLVAKDKKRQAKLLKSLETNKKLTLNDLGFDRGQILEVSKPIKELTTKSNIEKYVVYAKTFNDHQVIELDAAKKVAHDKSHTNGVANEYNTLGPTTLKALNDARKDIKDKNTYNIFINLFITDKTNDKNNHNAIEGTKIVAKNLGFKSTNGFEMPSQKPSDAPVTPAQFTIYNSKMMKFNSDQTSQLTNAKALAGVTYANDKANKNNHLTKRDKDDLNDARIEIKDNVSNEIFLELFKKLRDKDLKLEAGEISNAKINALGYLEKTDFDKINDLRKGVKDEASFDDFILEKNSLIAEDERKQGEAIKDSDQLIFNDLGFDGKIAKLSKPTLKHSTRNEIEAYTKNVTNFNVEQNALLLKYQNIAKNDYPTENVKDTDGNVVVYGANKYETLSKGVTDILNSARDDIKTKATYDAFIQMFKNNRKNDNANHEADNKNKTLAKDLGFTPTIDFEKPKDVDANATAAEILTYNKSMVKFNQDQAKQLTNAQTLAKSTYANSIANEYKHLKNSDFNRLNAARNQITNKTTYDAFLSVFKTSVANDLNAEAVAVNNRKINALGYLLKADFKTINNLRKAVKDKFTFDDFDAEKDSLIAKDKARQAIAIETSDKLVLNKLGFAGKTKKVTKPTLAVSTKKQIEAYALYVKAYNDEQAKLLVKAQNDAKDNYKTTTANVYKTLAQDIINDLDQARTDIKDKASFDRFTELFKTDQANDKANHNAAGKNKTVAKDLGFKPAGGSEKPNDLNKNATAAEYLVYNKAMVKFNQDQAKQLTNAQTLAKSTYANATANEYKHLRNSDFSRLNTARNKIINKTSYEAFLNLFRKLKAKDLNNDVVNKLGYLTNSELQEINAARLVVKDENTYDEFINKKDELMQKDQDRQATAINASDKLVLNKLGFAGKTKKVTKPTLAVSTKKQIEAYALYVKAYNDEQAKLLVKAQNDAKDNYKTTTANAYKTLAQDIINDLDQARTDIKDKASFDRFTELFKTDQANDKANHNAAGKNKTVAKDLGFKPAGGSEKPNDLNKNATAPEYLVYNKAMVKFNQDQAKQLTNAQTLAKSTYANATANEYKHLKNGDFNKLNTARGKIIDKASYEAFLNLFRTLKAKDLNNDVVNKLGYLTNSELQEINAARLVVNDENTYDEFITKKDDLMQKDQDRQATAIETSDQLTLNKLGFAGKTKEVTKPTLAVSTKKQIEAYALYAKAYNDEQAKLLVKAQNDAKDNYKTTTANTYKTLAQDIINDLDQARTDIKDKASFDRFTELFKTDQANDKANHNAAGKNKTVAKDLGFKPAGGSEKPNDLNKNATAPEYLAYNKAMVKFNQDQAKQLTNAQTLAKTTYANATANEYKHLKNGDFNKLNTARDKIIDKASYEAFLNLFRKLKAKDLNNDVVNKLGYLTNSELQEINAARLVVNDENTYDEFITKKDDLMQKDQDRQATAIETSDQLVLNKLGFAGKTKEVTKPTLAVSTKKQIEAYALYAKAYNDEQAKLLVKAQNDAKDNYKTTTANTYKTLAQDIINDLDQARTDIKDKASFDRFTELFKTDQANDKANHNAAGKNKTVAKDLGFKPAGGSEKPNDLNKNATAPEYLAYNKAMVKFNQDQAKQLTNAQTLAKTTYANATANEYKHLKNGDFNKLNTARDKIIDKASYEAFLNLFRTLKAKDLNNDVVNKLGYLTNSELQEINAARLVVNDENTYDEFITKKDDLMQKDQDRQATAIETSDQLTLNKLGFAGKTKEVTKPTLAVSTKKQIEAYALYAKAYNDEQAKLLVKAQNDAKDNYKTTTANTYKTLAQDIINDLDQARTDIKDKASFDRFTELFKTDQANDKANHNAAGKNKTVAKDLGFKPAGGSEKPNDLNKNATAPEYLAYNKAMVKFNQDQAKQLTNAQTLAKTTYANATANEYKHLKNGDFNKLNTARDKIIDKASYEAFLNLFRKLKAKDLNNDVVNKLGYLTNYELQEINAARLVVNDENTYDEFITKKDDLMQKDQDRQATAIETSDQLVLNKLGFAGKTKEVTKPTLAVSTKKQIEAYALYVKTYNDEQAKLLVKAQNDAKDNYKTTTANTYKTLAQDIINDLDQARTDIKDKASFDRFTELFKTDQANDKANHNAAGKNKTVAKDLGFKPAGGSEKPNDLNKNATAPEYLAYNKAMVKFNQDQAKQLTNAQTLAKTTYANATANEYKHLKNGDFNKLNTARDKIIDKASYEAFLNLFRKLKAKDLNNDVVNKLGYLTNSELQEINAARLVVNDENTYDEFITKKDDLMQKDQDRQATAIETSDQLVLNKLGFAGKTKEVTKPTLAVSTKKQIEAYALYVKAYNDEQAKLLVKAQNDAKDNYKTTTANTYKTLAQDIINDLDQARTDIKDKASFDRFTELFKTDQANDKANHNAAGKNKTVAKDLGFKPAGGSEKPNDLNKNATAPEYLAYNKAMVKFNQDQAKQLTNAQTLAKTTYANATANEYKHLKNGDFNKLNTARDKIIDKASYEAFLNLFRKLKAKDLNNDVVNKLGYLTNSELQEINAARLVVNDENTYDEFITKKDDLMQKDQDRQATAIETSDQLVLNKLGFAGKTKEVTKPTLAVSTKKQIEAYALYVKAYNDEQAKLLVKAQNDAKDNYKTTTANTYKTLAQDIINDLDQARTDIKDKASFDRFTELFKTDQANDKANHNAAGKNKTVAKDLGFKPAGGSEKPNDLNKNATAPEYLAYNKAMVKFNQDQAKQLTNAQTLAKTTYANATANEYKHLKNGDFNKLNTARDKIIDKASYEAFLNLFRKLKAKDLNNDVVNKLGYLTNSELQEINAARLVVNDENTYDEFITKKDDLMQKDQDRQATAIKKSNQLKLIDKGFPQTMDAIDGPTKGVSTKDDIKTYADYVKAFNAEQAQLLVDAVKEVNGPKYTNDMANKYKTLSSNITDALDAARKAVKTKATYDVFINLFKTDQANDLSNHNANDENQIKPKDKGFKPSNKEFGQPKPLEIESATADDYKAFNAQMNKFNEDQARQLENAKTLAKTTYADDEANENSNLDKISDLGKLDAARDNIKNKGTYDTFLNLFRTLKAKDLNNDVINKLGYLTNLELQEINTARLAVNDENTYDEFITKKDDLMQEGQNRQAIDIEKSNQLKLIDKGFPQTMDAIDGPTKGVSTKDDIKTYADYVKAFNAEQTQLLAAAVKEVNGPKYANDIANKYKTLSDNITGALDIARKAVKTKTTYDVFINLFKTDQANDLSNHNADDENQIKPKDKGFKPSAKDLGQPAPLKESATKADYKKFNAQMNKFNEDQARQLENAKTLAKTTYADDEANENSNLDKISDLGKLDAARDNIKNKGTYDTFLNLFRTLKAKDLNNDVINKLGYLTITELKEIDTARLAINDKDTYDKFIAKKGDLMQKDQNRQATAIEKSNQLKLIDKGFPQTMDAIDGPTKGVSTKEDIKTYADYVKTFNAEQAQLLAAAVKEVNGPKYTNNMANKYKTLSGNITGALDIARKAVKTKTTYDVFINLFKTDQANDLNNNNVNKKNQIKPEDKGFKPSTKDLGQPMPLKIESATADDYKRFNAQMNKFNDDQKQQLTTAKILAKTTYANDKANEYSNLNKAKDLGPLDVARDVIVDKKSNDAFLNLFRTLKAKDLNDDVINKLGYLTKYELIDIDDARKAIKDKDTYDKFIAKKDVLMQKDQDRQANEIVKTDKIKWINLGFDGKISEIDKPIKGASTKKQIEVYVNNAETFNKEQTELLKKAKVKANGADYKTAKANKYHTLSKEIIEALDKARENIKNRNTFDYFINLFKTDQDKDKLNNDVENKNKTIAKDLGFTPTDESFVKPGDLDVNATTEQFKAYNAQMTKFNEDQTNQLTTAKVLSKTTYSNENANKYGALNNDELDSLGEARKAIKDHDTNDIFVSMFDDLKEKDLKMILDKKYSDKMIDEIKDITDADRKKLKELRKLVKNDKTYKKFLKSLKNLKKKNWIQKAKEKYTDKAANEHNNLKPEDFVKLKTLRSQIKDKETYDEFVKEFNKLKGKDIKLEIDKEKYGSKKVNIHGLLTKKELNDLENFRKSIGKSKGFDEFIKQTEYLKKIDQDRYDLINKTGQGMIIQKYIKDKKFPPKGGEEKPKTINWKKATQKQKKEYNEKVVKYNLYQEYALNEMQERADEEYAVKSIEALGYPLTRQEKDLLKEKRDAIKSMPQYMEFRKYYIQLLRTSAEKLWARIKEVNKMEVNDYGFASFDYSIPKKIIVSEEISKLNAKEWNKSTISKYVKNLNGFNENQKSQLSAIMNTLNQFKIDKEHVVAGKIKELKKISASLKKNPGPGFLETYYNFVSEYSKSSKKKLFNPDESKTKKILIITIPAAGGLLIIILLSTILKLRVDQKRKNYLHGAIEKWEDDEQNELENDELDEWE